MTWCHRPSGEERRRSHASYSFAKREGRHLDDKEVECLKLDGSPPRVMTVTRRGELRRRPVLKMPRHLDDKEVERSSAGHPPRVMTDRYSSR